MITETTTEQKKQELKEFEKIGIKNLSKAQKRRYKSLKQYLKELKGGLK